MSTYGSWTLRHHVAPTPGLGTRGRVLYAADAALDAGAESCPYTLARILTMSAFERLASLQSERKIESSLSKRVRGASNSATLPASMTRMRS